jgi:glycosyltransferase involved in cell wall biosynthesis
MALKISIITNIIPHYREGFYDRLLSRPDCDVKIYCQEKIPGAGFKTIHTKYPQAVNLIKFFSLKNEKFVFQFLPWRKIMKESDVIFVSGNPRVLSDVIFGTFLLLMKKNVVLWTTGHSFRANPITEKIRFAWSKLFKYIFVYTDKEVDYLRTRGFKKNIIIGMNNGLDQTKIDEIATKWTVNKKQEWLKQNNLTDQTLILSCARLIEKNRFDLFVDAIPAIVKNIPDLKWCIIGDGEEKKRLQDKVRQLNVEKYIKFAGKIEKEEELAPWFLTASAFIHPAAIGLSMMHALGYGIPVVTHSKEELHGPEFAAFKENETGVSYQINDSKSLADAVVRLLENQDFLLQMKKKSLQLARNEYNVDIMLERFLCIANMCAQKNKMN